MAKVNILNYYRKILEKSRDLIRHCRRRRIRRIDIILIAAAIAVLVYIAVRQVSGTIVDKHTHIDITVSSHGGDLFGQDIVSALIREFEEQNPDLRIQESSPESADIVFFDDGEFTGLADAPAFASLAHLVTFMDVFIYNIDILKAANCDRPPKTRAEFLAAARAVAKSVSAASGQEAVYPFALGLSKDDPLAVRRDFYPWVWANSGEIHTEQGLSGTALETIAFLGQLNRERLLAPQTFEKTGAQRLQEFAKGSIAMMMASSRDIPFLQNNAQNMSFSITTIPVIAYDRNRLGLSGIYAGVNSSCTYPDEARLLLTFLEEKKHILAEAIDAVPGSFPGVFADDYIENNPLYAKAWDIFEAAVLVEYEPGQPHEKEIQRIIRDKLAEAIK